MTKNTKTYATPEQLARSIESVLNTEEIFGVVCFTDSPENLITVCSQRGFALGAIGIKYTDHGWIPCVIPRAEMLLSFGKRGRERFFQQLGLEGEG